LWLEVHMNICSYILSRNTVIKFPNILTTHPVYLHLILIKWFDFLEIRGRFPPIQWHTLIKLQYFRVSVLAEHRQGVGEGKDRKCCCILLPERNCRLVSYYLKTSWSNRRKSGKMYLSLGCTYKCFVIYVSCEETIYTFISAYANVRYFIWLHVSALMSHPQTTIYKRKSWTFFRTRNYILKL
jgi:hypothetical protein